MTWGRRGPRTYVLVNHLTGTVSDGIGNYSRAVLDELRRGGIDTAFITRGEEVSDADYRTFVLNAVTHFSSTQIVVEAPEVACSTALLPPEYRVHVRLHCPNALVQAHNEQPIDWEQFGEELAVARRAHAVSSPSYALLHELRPFLDVSRIHVYKNPPPAGVTLVDAGSKRHDVVFLGRFRRVKGVDFLNPVLSALPSSYSVVLGGRGSEAFAVSPSVRCRVSARGEVFGQERYRLLGEARVVLMLSRFENCSMLVLESLAVGTVVVGWQVGGHSEIAGPDLIRLVPFGDTDALVAAVVAAVEGISSPPDRFRAATARVAEDFRQGWRQVWDSVPGGRGVYRGLDASGGAKGGMAAAPLLAGIQPAPP
jgi:glycosyltransferase involved in cell wall biosynthesis